MQQLSLFRGVHDTQPRPVTLEELVTMMRTDQSVRDLTEKHRYARATGDEQGASRYKKMMTSFGVAARFEGGRQQRHIVEYTGLSLADFDHIPEERMAEVLAKVRADEHTLVAYTTLSGLGLRVLFRYETPSTPPEGELTGSAEPSSPLRDTMSYPLPLRGLPLSQRESADSSIAEYNIANEQTKKNCPSETGGRRRETSVGCDDGRFIFQKESPKGLCNDVERSGGGMISANQYRLAFTHGNEYYSRLLGLPYDPQCKNATRISTIAYDENVYYNPEAVAFVIEPEEKNSVGRPRKGTKVERVEAAVLSELEQRGVVYGPGSHNKYISDACYMMNRYGVTESDCTAWALEKFSDYNEAGNDVASIVRSCYEQTEEHGTVRLPRDESNVVSDIEEFLRSQGEFRRNVITGFPEIRYLNGCWQQFTDDDRNSLWRELSKRLRRKVLRQDISAVVKSDFSPKYNAFEEYVNRLQPWDGVTDHIARLASSVTVKGDQEYFARCFKKWLVAFIAAIFDAEEVNHEILVFIGRQGSYKSTWFHYLLPPELRQYFLPKLMSSAGITKDDLFKIAQSGLVCLEEIDNMKQRDLNQLKALTTMRTINERRSYGEFNEFHRHIASFCATGNNRFFLTDPTGNRRFLTFEVESIVPPQTYDYGYEGVYAQAYALWKQGFRYWFNDEENVEINRHNMEFEAPNKELELIQKYYRAPMEGEECKFLTATDILERINGSIKEQLSTVRIGIALRTMGIERVRSGNARGYRLVEISPEQININQRALGNFTDVNDNDDENR